MYTRLRPAPWAGAFYTEQAPQLVSKRNRLRGFFVFQGLLILLVKSIIQSFQREGGGRVRKKKKGNSGRELDAKLILETANALITLAATLFNLYLSLRDK